MMLLSAPQWIIVAVAALRLAELIYAARNQRRLLAAGGREIGAGHYPLFVLLHGAWLIALFVLVPADAPIRAVPLVLFGALLAARLWVIQSLGRFWTTRIVTVPGAPLVRSGPYRFVRHPNYLVVAGEIAVLPLVFGAWPIALVFSAINAALLSYRIRVEDAALGGRRAL
jgi:methyltransferase